MSSLNQKKPFAICGKPHGEQLCSFFFRRCADVDLHRWLSGAYAVPAVEDDDGETRLPDMEKRPR